MFPLLHVLTAEVNCGGKTCLNGGKLLSEICFCDCRGTGFDGERCEIGKNINPPTTKAKTTTSEIKTTTTIKNVPSTTEIKKVNRCASVISNLTLVTVTIVCLFVFG